ncbi:hypothetical protein SGCOL_011083 [Colletotrichum sp. CLE4]
MSRFVSAGAINAETGEAVVEDTTTMATTTNAGGARSVSKAAEAKKSAEWEIVQRELDAERKRREEARVKSVEGGEKSLYDVLQANKAAKQAAFEEANKIKNQFRALDDDEIDFLDEVRASKRAEEDKVRRETEEGLAAFRRAQGGGGSGVKRAGDGDGEKEEEEEEENAAAPVDGGDDGDGEWAVGPRKRRRRDREKGFGVRREKGDEKGDGLEKSVGKGGTSVPVPVPAAATTTTTTPASAPAPAPVKGKPSLVAYGSDSDDD